ncbi:MAG TPA: serine hydrolase, partial [Chitinophagaceae bacterium]|nr:serine hydrolase [Chitinophagaceae bacterium]
SAGHDWAWTFNTNFPEDVYLKRIKHQETFAPLRTQFQYSNFMFFALSVLSGKLYNTTWNDLVAKKLFQPLEMNNTYSNYASRASRLDNAALAYEFNDSFNVKATNQMDDLLGAGSVNSTASDLAHYLQMWINGGTFKNKQILSPGFARRSVKSHFMVHDGLNDQFPDEHFNNVGLCWFLSSYRGHYKAHHNGNIDGFSSTLTFFPFDSLGIVVLTNQNNSPLIRLVPDFVADLAFNLPVRDKNSVMFEMRKKYQAGQKRPPLVNVDTIRTKPFFSLQKYSGHFTNPGYGEIKIGMHKKALVLTYNNLKLLLIPRGGHRFSSHHWWEEGIFPNGVGPVVFKFNNGVLQSFQIPFEPAVKDIVFSRQ